MTLGNLCLYVVGFGAILLASNSFTDAAIIRKIVGGSNAMSDFHRWQAFILARDSADDTRYPGCGGVLVESYWVLTTARCLTYGNVEFYLVGVGIRNVTKAATILNRYVGVERAVVHPNYNSSHNFMGTNLALLRLAKKQNVHHVVCISSANSMFWEQLNNGGRIRNCYATGYGETDTANYAEILQQIKIQYVSKKLCDNPYRHTSFSPDKICSLTTLGKDTCNGDIGGPVVCEATRRSDCRGYHLVGLTFAGASVCGNGSKPGMSVSILPYVEWILSIAIPSSIPTIGTLTTAFGH